MCTINLEPEELEKNYACNVSRAVRSAPSRRGNAGRSNMMANILEAVCEKQNLLGHK